MKQILKVLIGSQAHGLATEDSDIDYRGVYVTPTADLLRLGSGGYKGNSWVEGEKEDNTSYEVAHFLHLAMKSNPTILEVFAAPVVEETNWGLELRKLFPYVWSSRAVLEAFKGYSLNQRKKMLDDKYEFRSRRWKYAAAYVRTLIQAIHLLRTEEMIVKVPAVHVEMLRNMKAGELSVGECINTAGRFTVALYQEFEENPNHEKNLEPLNEFLLKVRREYWNE